MKDYEDVLDETDRRRRIEIVLTDAYGEDERQAAFCCYLEDHMSFPFRARMRDGEGSGVVTGLGFTTVRPHRFVCRVDLDGAETRMPLTEIEPVEGDSVNSIVIGDYLEFLGA
jgi:hypothetical protein